MSSTEFNIGYSGTKNSSRVLKPPGGGHSDIFGAPENKAINPRPKYDQQNSSNLNFCMNTTDPNILVAQAKSQNENVTANGGGGGDSGAGGATNGRSTDNITHGGNDSAPQAQPKGRVPPGGFSSGLW